MEERKRKFMEDLQEGHSIIVSSGFCAALPGTLPGAPSSLMLCGYVVFCHADVHRHGNQPESAVLPQCPPG